MSPINSQPEHNDKETSLPADPAPSIKTDVESRVQIARTILNTVNGAASPIVLFDKDSITQQIDLWRRSMSGVTPHFAVKCCNAKPVLRHMNSKDLCFDAATAGEIKLLEDIGVNNRNVICTHPIREAIDVDAIKRFKPRGLVVDSIDELRKLELAGIPSKEYSPEIMVRVELPFGGLSQKFGVEVAFPSKGPDGNTHWHFETKPVRDIFREAQKIEKRTECSFAGFGLSSHVGTNTSTTEKYEILLNAFSYTKESLAKHGIPLTTFNLGGGYCDPKEAIKQGTSQETFITNLGNLVANYREKHPDVHFIAEPGRFMVADAGTVIIGITSATTRMYLPQSDGSIQEVKHLNVHMNDGLYGNLLGERHDDQIWDFIPFRLDSSKEFSQQPPLPSVLNGKTCDSWDKIQSMRNLPPDLHAGDLLLIPVAGAYTITTATEFNSVGKSCLAVFERANEGQLHCSLFDSLGNEINGENLRTPLSLASFSTIRGRDIPTLSLAGQSLAPNLSIFAGESANLKFVRPGELIGDAGWQKVLHLLAINDLYLNVKNPRIIAEGGMGWVLKSTDKNLGREVALKIGKISADGDLGERFRAEASKTAELKSPNIPTIFNFGVLPNGKHPYYTMEYIVGRTIEDHIKDLHRNSGSDKIDWRTGQGRSLLRSIKETGDALTVAHNRGIIHRDIKPSNLIIPDSDKNVAVKVLDWGLFKSGIEKEVVTQGAEFLNSGLTRVGAVLGTVDYMSPEQARGEEISNVTDVWALGATLYSTLTNKVPLGHHGDEQSRLVALQKGVSGLIDLDSLNSVPSPLKSIVLKAMATDQKMRYQSAAAFSKDVQSYLEGMPVEAHTERLGPLGAQVYKVNLFIQRQWKIVTAAAATTVIGVGGALWIKADQEFKRETAIKAAESDRTFQEGKDALSRAIALAEKNELGESIAELSENLLRDLQRDGRPEAIVLCHEIAHRREDYLQLKSFKDQFFRVYSSLINNFDLGSIQKIDVNKLEVAAKIYLPEGLTAEGIKNLRTRLDNSSLSQEQKLQIGDGLMEWAVYRVIENNATVLRDRHIRDKLSNGEYIIRSTKELCEKALKEIDLLQNLANAVEGIDFGKRSESWGYLIEHLRMAVYDIDRARDSYTNKEEAEAKYERLEGESLAIQRHYRSPRASTSFLMGSICYQVKINEETLITENLSVLPLASDHIASPYLLSDIHYREFNRAVDPLDREHNLRRVIETLEQCNRLDPTNPYILGRLTIVCRIGWDLVRPQLFEERKLMSVLERGVVAGRKCITICEQQHIDCLEVKQAFGELTLSINYFDESSRALGEVIEREPSNNRAMVLWACSEIRQKKEIDTAQEATILHVINSPSNLEPRILPEAAELFCFFARKAQLEGNLDLAATYKTSAIQCIKLTLDTVPQYKDMIERLAELRYGLLLNDPLFQNLLK